VTETVNQPGIVHYDLGGTIWGGSQFVLNLTNGALMSGMYRFRGRPRPAMGQIIRTSASAPGLRGEAQDRGRSLTILVLACRREDVPGGYRGLGWAHPRQAITLGPARAFPVPPDHGLEKPAGGGVLPVGFAVPSLNRG
jgi:hypothetical protein